MEKKELIRKYAIKVIAKYGYHNTKVQMIADEAGIANGTVYYYFKSKQEILEYIYDVELEKFSKYFDELEKSEGTVLEKLDDFMNYSFREWQDNFDVLKILIQDGIFPANYDLNITKLFVKLRNKLSHLLEEGFKSGELKEVDANSFAFIITNLLCVAIYEFKVNGNTDNYKNRQTQLINFILDGIRKK
jgi:AcrR family transcriptional regulator